jgi:hypothetical protein
MSWMILLNVALPMALFIGMVWWTLPKKDKKERDE